MNNNTNCLKAHITGTKKGHADFVKGQDWAAEKIANGAAPEALENWAAKQKTGFGFGVAEYVWNFRAADRARSAVMSRITLLGQGVVAGSKDARFELLGLLDSEDNQVVVAARKALGLSK
jgi:hypothetical protein